MDTKTVQIERPHASPTPILDVGATVRIGRPLLCIGPAMAEGARQVSGQAMMFQMLVDLLAEAGNQVKVFDISERQSARADGALAWRRVADYVRILPQVWRSLLLRRGSVVYITTAQGLWGFLRDAAVIWPASLLGHAVVTHQFGANYKGFYGGQPPIVRFLIKKTLSQAHAVIVEGDYTKEQFSFLPGWRRKVHSVPNGLPERTITYSETARTLDPGRPFSLFYLSNMVETKGYWDVLEAVRSLVNERGKRVRCRFVGKFLASSDSVRFPDPEQARKAFWRYIEEHDLAGVVSYEEMLLGLEKAEAFEAADLFILPSNYISEGQPVSVLEAMAHGVVTVATRYRLIPSMVEDGQTGFFVGYNRPQEIADKIELLMDNPSLYTELSRNSLEKFHNEFRPERYIARVASVFKSVTRMQGRR